MKRLAPLPRDEMHLAAEQSAEGVEKGTEGSSARRSRFFSASLAPIEEVHE